MYVKPKDGRQVPYPEINALLPEAGAEVEDNQYWQRRIADGDVEVTEPPPEAAKEAAKPPPGKTEDIKKT